MNTEIRQTGFYRFSHGQCFVAAQTKLPSSEAVVIIPPFAEEMNKSRHLFSALMQQLSAAGQHCFMLDNFGTGDSEGDLDQATTLLWRTDLQLFIQRLAAQGYQSISFVALRFGTLQLFDLLNATTLALPVTQLVLWQPMFDVSRFWQQFVRIKVAEAMAGGEKLSQKQIEQQLTDGDTVDIAGYPLTQVFYQSLLQLDATPPLMLSNLKLHWFETSKLDTIAIPVQKMREQLTAQTDLQFVQIKAEPFWQTSELAPADELIALTVNALTGAADAK